MTEMGGPSASPQSGWYPDPSGDGRLRYWNGSAWTNDWAAPTPSSAGAPPPQTGWSGAPPSPPRGTVGGPYPGGGPAPVGSGAGPPKSGMSGCLKAFLITFAVASVGAVILVVSLVVIGSRVVHHITTTVAGTAGRPSSLASGASDYAGERKQDHVAGSNGQVVIGSLSATAPSWARKTDGTAKLICGPVTIRRSTVKASDPFDAALQLAGDFAWELVPPSGDVISYDPVNSSLSSLDDYLTTDQTGNATGTICFADPGTSGQFAITWQPRLLRAERAVWIVKLN